MVHLLGNMLDNERSQRFAKLLLWLATLMLLSGVVMQSDSKSHATIWTILQVVGLIIGALCLPFALHRRLIRIRGRAGVRRL
jgi:hypothetical protein